MAEIITFGEAMLRLVPPHHMRLEQAVSLNLTVGGSEYNVAVDLARLGKDAAWVSLVPDNPLGKYVRNKAREHGVDTEQVIFSREGRQGTYYVEFGASPRASKVYYDRDYSSISLMTEEPDWKNILEGASWFHTSGITPALSDACAESVRTAVETAKKTGAVVSYDLNYRKKLWTPEKAQEVTKTYADKIDFCIGNEEDFQKVLGVEIGSKKDSFEKVDTGYYTELAAKVHREFGFSYVAISLRDSLSVLRNNWKGLLYTGGKAYISKEYELEVIDRVGGGDSFSAGLIFAVSGGMKPQEAVEFAAAFSALKHTIPGDLNIVDLDEVNTLLKNSSARIER